VLQLARDAGFTVEEADIPVKDALAADEVFTTGMQPQ
jgi:branched-subunit amino acid aminotransferase/4-amino-4-deoxychorismate lyase